MKAPIRPLSRIIVTAAMASAFAPAVSSVSALGAVAAYAQTAETATVTIVKDAQPNGPRNFHFTTDMRHNNEEALDNFALDDDPTSVRPNTEQFDGVLPGTYWVSERQEDGWTLEDIDCTGGQVSKDLAARRVTITVGAGDEVACTFVNVRNAQGETTTPPATPPATTPSTTSGSSQPVQDGSSQAVQPAVSGDLLAAVQPADQPSANTALPAELPRTGSGAGMLAGFGAALIAAGAAVLARSRRQTGKSGVQS